MAADAAFRPSIEPLRLWTAGRRAMREVPGLRRRVAYGFALNLLLYVMIAACGIAAYVRFVHQGLTRWFTAHTPAWAAAVAGILLIVLLCVVALVLLFFSLRISLKFMVLWYEDLVDRVVTHVRGPDTRPFSLKSLIRDIGYMLWDLTRELCIALGLFFIGLIPVIGPVLVFLGAGHLMGRAVMEPYLCVLRTRGEKIDLGQNNPLGTLKIGWTGVLPALVPVVGWLLLPLSLVHQVLGLAYQAEHSRLAQTAPPGSAEPSATAPS